MPRKAKPKTQPVENGSKERPDYVKYYPSLQEGPTPAERLAKLIRKARRQGIKPMNEEELERWIESFRGRLWRDDDEIDAFVAQVREWRRTGK